MSSSLRCFLVDVCKSVILKAKQVKWQKIHPQAYTHFAFFALVGVCAALVNADWRAVPLGLVMGVSAALYFLDDGPAR